ncbi:hypothetical protein SKAU_G00119080 [Synaphobranchus kaupii]|uniref:Uncharacterized protein n=1 Tax=Synaphobranchus kaupii TaxID=118154 RepID=A0A9Q1J030_SYNKA|nr:hypothetical protein SKAU_G00119080 [Synaphobranchus kaupii]
MLFQEMSGLVGWPLSSPCHIRFQVLSKLCLALAGSQPAGLDQSAATVPTPSSGPSMAGMLQVGESELRREFPPIVTHCSSDSLTRSH